MAKITSAEEAIKYVCDGDVILASGFYGNGTSAELVDELLHQGKKDLTIVNNDGGSLEKGLGKLIYSGAVKKFICTWCGRLAELPNMVDDGKIDLELCPQGSFVERIRAAGYGLGGVLTPTGLNTVVEEKWAERVHLNGKDFLYHTPIKGNVAIIEADRADETGNLVFHLTQRGFGTVMAFAADLTIVSVKNPIEPPGNIHPEDVDVPGIVVDILVPQKGVK